MGEERKSINGSMAAFSPSLSGAPLVVSRSPISWVTLGLSQYAAEWSALGGEADLIRREADIATRDTG